MRVWVWVRVWNWVWGRVRLRVGVEVVGLKVWGLGFQGSEGFRVWGFRAPGYRCRACGTEALRHPTAGLGPRAQCGYLVCLGLTGPR